MKTPTTGDIELADRIETASKIIRAGWCDWELLYDGTWQTTNIPLMQVIERGYDIRIKPQPAWEPKFKVGDKIRCITNPPYTCSVDAVGSSGYIFSDGSIHSFKDEPLWELVPTPPVMVPPSLEDRVAALEQQIRELNPGLA